MVIIVKKNGKDKQPLDQVPLDTVARTYRGSKYTYLPVELAVRRGEGGLG